MLLAHASIQFLHLHLHFLLRLVENGFHVLIYEWLSDYKKPDLLRVSLDLVERVFLFIALFRSFMIDQF